MKFVQVGLGRNSVDSALTEIWSDLILDLTKLILTEILVELISTKITGSCELHFCHV